MKAVDLSIRGAREAVLAETRAGGSVLIEHVEVETDNDHFRSTVFVIARTLQSKRVIDHAPDFIDIGTAQACVESAFTGE